MDNPQRSISFRELSWDDVDSFAKNHGFKDRSPFIEYCTSKVVNKSYYQKISNVVNTLVMLLGFIIIILLILIGR